MDLDASFGHWLTLRRKALRLSRVELARRVGCAAVTLRKIEADERRPSQQIAAKLADQLNITDQERSTFIKAARGELGVARLSPPTQLADRPPLATRDPLRTKLPIPSTSLVGRAHDVAVVRDYLTRADVRLLTLLGAPGIGKTRLALQVALELHDASSTGSGPAFADGVAFIPLATVREPELVLATIVQALEIGEAPGQPLLERLQIYLCDRQMLLVLDNVEQVLKAAPQLAALLTAAPRLTLLVTSRVALHLSGEQRFAVPPLALPPSTIPHEGGGPGREWESLRQYAALHLSGEQRFAVPPLALPPSSLPQDGRESGRAAEPLTQYAAVELFVQRARATLPTFALTVTNALAVATICRRLDGLPLAIELAAARVGLFTPQELLEQLDQRLTLLTTGAVDLPTRQQTLRRAIDWSYELLDGGEQPLFRRLGVFVGGWTLEAARTVCDAADDLGIDVLEGMAALLDKSLLQRAEGSDEPSRYTMLETIREYALERLEESGEAETLRQRHAGYFLGLAERAEPLLLGAEQLVWLDRLKAEHDNLRAVLAWSQVTANSAEVTLRLAAALWLFWEYGGYLSEGREQLTRILAHPDATAPTIARARALFVAGYLVGVQGDFALAHTHLTESQTLSRTIAYQQGVAYALYGLGFVAWLQGEYATARALHAESLALFRELGERWTIAMSLYSLGQDEVYLDAYEPAMALHEESLTLFRELGDRVMYGHALLSLGYAARLQGDDTRAAASYAESLVVFQDLGTMWGIAAAQLSLGYLVLAQGDAPRAAVYFAESLVRYQEMGHQEGISVCLAGSAGAARSLDQPARAARLFGAAEGLRARIGAGEQPIERAVYAESVASVRAALGEDAFAAAWTEGRAMTLEQVIAYALES